MSKSFVKQEILYNFSYEFDNSYRIKYYVRNEPNIVKILNELSNL